MDDKKQVIKKYHAIDITKFIMAIVVVMIHSGIMEMMKGTLLYQIYDVIRKMAVPFFFMASAYLLFYRMQGEYRSQSNTEKIKNYIFKMAKLYIVWSLIYLPLAIYNYIQIGNGWIKSSIAYIRGFFVCGFHHYSVQLWYLLSAVYGAIVIRFLLKRGWKEWNILILSFLVYTIAYGMNCIIDNQENLQGIWLAISKFLQKVFLTANILYGFCYLSIGMCIAKYKTRIKFGVLVVVNIVLFITMMYFNHFILLLLLNICFFMLMLSIDLKDRKIYYYFREASIIIYFSHMLFNFIVDKNGIKATSGLLGFEIILSCSLGVSLLLIIFERKKNHKFYKLLFH